MRRADDVEFLSALARRLDIDERAATALLAEALRERGDLDVGDRRRLAESFRLYTARRRLVDYLIDHTADRGYTARVAASHALAGWISREEAQKIAPRLDWHAILDVDARLGEIADETARFAVRHSLPDAVARELRADWGDEAESLAVALGAPPPRTLRVNSLVTTRETAADEFAGLGLEVEPTRWSPHGLHVAGAVDLFREPSFVRGEYEIQDEASQLVALLVAPPPRGRVLDACAGSGGKTLAVAALLENKGSIRALDPSRRRLDELRRRAARARAFNVVWSATALETWDAETSAFARRADRILVDAPCSGSGSLRRHPDARWRLDADGLASLAATQEDLLRRAAEHLAPRARLIYATCSVLRSENEDRIESLLAERPDLEGVLPREILGRDLAEPFESPDRRYFVAAPHRHGTDGFFAAVLRRR